KRNKKLNTKKETQSNTNKLNIDFYYNKNNSYDDIYRLKSNHKNNNKDVGNSKNNNNKVINENYYKNINTNTNLKSISLGTQLNRLIKTIDCPIKYIPSLPNVIYIVYLENQLLLFVKNKLQDKILITSIYNCLKIKNIDYVKIYQIICKALKYIEKRIFDFLSLNKNIESFEELSFCMFLVSIFYYDISRDKILNLRRIYKEDNNKYFKMNSTSTLEYRLRKE
ncbi:hypothetical protein SLOPH_661, partial [Spraguea lophii 42_110]